MFDQRQRPPLPSSKPCEYTANEVQDIGRLSAAQGLAAAFGIPRKFLSLTEKISREDFSQHRFQGVEFPLSKDEMVHLPVALQQEKVMELVEGWPTEHPLVVINSYPHVFIGAQNASTSVEHFLYHLLSALAVKAAQMRTLSGVDVSFLWLMQLEFQRMYLLKPNHVLVWGVLTENPGSYDLSKTSQFLLNFTSYTRILLTSAPDVAQLLDKLRVSPSYVDYIFNMYVDTPTKKEIPAAFKRKKAKAQPKKVTI